MLNDALRQPILGAMKFLNEISTSYPDAISFSSGRPAEQYFDVQGSLNKMSRFVKTIAIEQGKSEAEVLNTLGQYSNTNGIINSIIAKLLETEEKIDISPDYIMTTSGCQEALSICMNGLFQKEYDVLLVADPTYIGITGLTSMLGVEMKPIICNEDGLDIMSVEKAISDIKKIGKRARALYVIPDFSNPLGVAMPLEARRKLLDLAYSNKLLVLEDNTYGIFRYEGEKIPTLKSLDTQKSVIYIGTFSKTIFPGLRIGFLAADQYITNPDNTQTHLINELSKVKSFLTINTSPLLQAILGGVLLDSGPSFADYLQDKISFYKDSRDLMLYCLDRSFPTEFWSRDVSWTRPEGGFFITVNLPFIFDNNQLIRCANDYRVICCPMFYFSITPGREKQVRLSFSSVNRDQINNGIERFASFVHDTIRGSF
jgi:(S)-3,5-dihydroxyphenylglycine transaminase